MTPPCPTEPRANRVAPDGTFLATTARGLFTGNRGILHDASGAMGRARWRHKAWITCTTVLPPGCAPLPMAAPGHYTPLFFLDEAVACAAGHRPCALCRRGAWQGFRQAWAAVFGAVSLAPQIDAALHVARIDPASRTQRRLWLPGAGLPSGAFVVLDDAAHLVWQEAALPWTPQGYGPARRLPKGPLTVLTPAPTLAVMRAGWCPEFGPGGPAMQGHVAGAPGKAV